MADTKIQDTPNIVETALEAGKVLGQKVHTHPHPRGMPFLVLTDKNVDDQIVYLDEHSLFEVPPSGKAGRALFHDIDSFLRYWKEHSHPHSRVYAEMHPAVRFTAVFDDHGFSDARWREHRAVYTPEYSREWVVWTKQSGKAFDGNAEMAHWLEDNLPDVVIPYATVLMDVVKTFRAEESVQWRNAVSLENGSVDLTYARVVDGSATSQGGRVEVPNMLRLRIPVWTGLAQELYDVDARLRYRLSGAVLKIWFELMRPHKVVERAFEELVSNIRASGAVMYAGSPER